MFTRSPLRDIPPTVIFRSRNGKLVHQPVVAGQVRGLGDISLRPIQNTAPGLPMIPTMDVARTQMKIAESETLRLAPIGPGLPGTYVSPDVLRSTTGRTLGPRSGVPSSTPSSADVNAGLLRSRDFVLRSSGGVSPSEQPTGGGMMSPMPMPTLTPEEMERLRASAGRATPIPGGDISRCPGLTQIECLWALYGAKVLSAGAGFAVGLGLLLLRRK